MIPSHNLTVADFARHHRLDGLTGTSLRALIEHRDGYSVKKARRFLGFQDRINRELLCHRVIIDNAYTAWFKRGTQTLRQVRSFVVQFSVFSNQFLIAQLHKTINADTLDGMRTSKEILANEIGVLFNGPRARTKDASKMDREGDPELVAIEGSVEGGTFRFRAAHFEWLLRIAHKLNLQFTDVGRREHGFPSTLFFCDELIRLYGSSNYETSAAASYAVENWAAAGFWDELVEGLTKFKRRTQIELPLAFFTWHSRLEAQHALHTQEELEELYCTRDIDEDRFIEIGNEMLEAVATFWEGLDTQRRELAVDS